jgi:excisionase family DNA binding protein
MPTGFITTTEAALLTGYTDDYIRRLIRSGQVKGKKFARSWQVNRSSLEAYKRKAEKIGGKRGRKSAN